MTATKRSAGRGAFTLVELLVVIILIMILAGLAAAFLPAIGSSARAAQGGTMLQQWILTARQNALRKQVPCGIRLVPYVDRTIVDQPPTAYTKFDASVGRKVQMPAQVRQCQYIEQPDDFTVSPAISAQNGQVGNLITPPPPPPGLPALSVFVHTQYPDGTGMALSKLINTGDYLEILGNGLMHKIGAIGQPNANRNFPGKTEIVVNSGSPILYPVNAPGTRQWRVVRAPRPTGDDVLQLPDGVIIDLKSNDANGNNLPIASIPVGQPAVSFTPIDILFSPSGAVITPGYTNDSINLWVREYNPIPNPLPPPPLYLDPDDSNPTHSEQTIIAVYVRTGLTAAHPPAPGTNPYAFIQDGRTSGK